MFLGLGRWKRWGWTRPCSGGRAGGKREQWCTSVVDVGGRQLLDIVPGSTVESAAGWFRSQSTEWCEAIRWAVLDMSGPYQVDYDRVLPHAYQVADPFHVVRWPIRCVDLVRRRVQNETLGHQGRKGDPLYRIRRLMTVVRNGSEGCCGLVTHTERYAMPGTQKRASGTSTRSAVLNWLPSSPSIGPGISRTGHSVQR